MKKERYTFAIMPSSGQRMKSFSLSRSFLISIFVSLSIILALSLAFGSFALIRFCNKNKEKSVEAMKKYEALNKELREIREIYSDFRAIIADDLGIEAKESSSMGRGGPEMPELNETSDAGDVYSDDDSLEFSMDLPSVLKEAEALKTDLRELAAIAKNNVAKLAMTPSIWPVIADPEKPPWISSRFGKRRSPFTGAWEMHEGLDIPSCRGTPLIATADGVVEEVKYDRYLGNYVKIKHNDKFCTRYGHMERFADDIDEGETVKRGDIIGYMGRTGRSTGIHVHYEVWARGRRVNPRNYILN
ncbi:peptidoglycan DD-metalloendopeptidase family protein [Candidatus Poribacteria bacterium]|nr:peptidoglycan DD-metalloendopeptidase family protein [Candidatus Poribacteria bacterium]